MAYHGKSANAVFGTALVNLQNWTLSPTADTTEVTAMGDTWMQSLSGLTDYTASVEGLSKKALDTVALLGTSATLEMSLDVSGPELSGSSILTSLSETVGYEGNGTISYGFEGNSATGLKYLATDGAAATGSADAFHGKTLVASYDDGSLTAFTEPREWSISMSCAIADTTSAHASNTGKTKAAGVNSATATVTCVASGDREVLEGTTLTDLQLQRTSTAADGYYTGAAICTGAETGTDRDGIGIVTYSFQYTDTVDLAVV